MGSVFEAAGEIANPAPCVRRFSAHVANAFVRAYKQTYVPFQQVHVVVT